MTLAKGKKRGNPYPEIYEDYVTILGQRSQTLTAFLGGITFGATTFLMQAGDRFDSLKEGYSDFLIVWLALTSMFFIFASAFYTIMALTKKEYSKGFTRPVIVFTWMGFASLILLVPYLVRPFSDLGFQILLIAVFIFGGIWLICHIVGFRREKRHPSRPRFLDRNVEKDPPADKNANVQSPGELKTSKQS